MIFDDLGQCNVGGSEVMRELREAMGLIDTNKVDGWELLDVEKNVSHEHFGSDEQQLDLFLLNHGQNVVPLFVVDQRRYAGSRQL